jgi:hypothetical protein
MPALRRTQDKLRPASSVTDSVRHRGDDKAWIPYAGMTDIRDDFQSTNLEAFGLEPKVGCCGHFFRQNL